MKICKYCQSEIKEKAKICPYCNKKQSNKVLKKELLILFVIFIGIGTIISIINPESEKSNKNSFSDIFKEKFTVSETDAKLLENNTVNINGKITNNQNRRFNNVNITYDIYNGNREKVGLATVTLSYIEAKETVNFTATGLSQYGSNMEYRLANITTD